MLTDNEITKALKCCQTNKCDECPVYKECHATEKGRVNVVLDLINRQKAEIERLNNEVNLLTENSISTKYPCCVLCGNGAILTKTLDDYDNLIGDISAEAYNEFAERLKRRFIADSLQITIDEVLAELTEGNGNA